jgi:hypothetical protein
VLAHEREKGVLERQREEHIEKERGGVCACMRDKSVSERESKIQIEFEREIEKERE